VKGLRSRGRDPMILQTLTAIHGLESVVTALFTDWSRSERGALGQLLPLVCEELPRIAARQLGWERVGYTLQPARGCTKRIRGSSTSTTASLIGRVTMDVGHDRD